MVLEPQGSYDRVLYPGYCYPQTHPDRLATLAALFGMKPAPVEHCRVLELGCGDGGNLIPMAFGLPDGQFVGVDSAARPIAKGQSTAEALGLTNITLNQLDILQVSPDLGQFDYIIAHGIYSWVPPVVRDKILEICHSHLAPNGVAYVSYNAYPGGHLRDMVREMMLFHVRDMVDPDQKINQAAALVKFLAESKSEPDLYRMLLGKTLEQMTEGLEQYGGSVFYHDALAQVNSPMYFYKFVEHAAEHDLQFIAEANFFEMQGQIYPPRVTEVLDGLAHDIIAREQYLDFLKCRQFRQTLLCHAGVTLDRSLNPDCVRDFYVASPAWPTSAQPKLDAQTEEEFRAPKGAGLKTAHPLAKAALLHLRDIWPRAIHFDELLATAQSRLEGAPADKGSDAEQASSALAKMILAMYSAGVVELHVHVPQFVVEASERPTASPVARLQIESQPLVTNLRHCKILIEGELARHLLRLLDGTRDRSALLKKLSPMVESGAATIQQNGQTITDAQQALKILGDELEPNLAKLARLALLVA